jgi:hypothetical protein
MNSFEWIRMILYYYYRGLAFVYSPPKLAHLAHCPICNHPEAQSHTEQYTIPHATRSCYRRRELTTGEPAPAGTRSTFCGRARPSAPGCRSALCTRSRPGLLVPTPAGTMPPAPAYAVLAAAFRTNSPISGTHRNHLSFFFPPIFASLCSDYYPPRPTSRPPRERIPLFIDPISTLPDSQPCHALNSRITTIC